MGVRAKGETPTQFRQHLWTLQTSSITVGRWEQSLFVEISNCNYQSRHENLHTCNFFLQLRKYCTRNSHCERGFQCYKKRCIRTRKCRTASDCPENHICNSFSGACLPSRPRLNLRSNRHMLLPNRQHPNARSNRLMVIPRRQYQSSRYGNRHLMLMPLRGHGRHGRNLRGDDQPMWIWN